MLPAALNYSFFYFLLPWLSKVELNVSNPSMSRFNQREGKEGKGKEKDFDLKEHTAVDTILGCIINDKLLSFNNISSPHSE